MATVLSMYWVKLDMLPYYMSAVNAKKIIKQETQNKYHFSSESHHICHFHTNRKIVCLGCASLSTYQGPLALNNLKAKKTHGFNSCIVISVYSLDILSIKKATEYRNN